MYLYPENPGCGLELEIARHSPDDLRIYLNVFSLEIWPLEDNKVPVTLFIDENRYDVLADCFQGGQRFLLPAEIYTQILEALSSSSRLSIYLGRYRTEITAAGFSAAHVRLFNTN